MQRRIQNSVIHLGQDEPSKICGRQPLKDLEWQTISLQIFGSLFLNTLFHLKLSFLRKSSGSVSDYI